MGNNACYIGLVVGLVLHIIIIVVVLDTTIIIKEFGLWLLSLVLASIWGMVASVVGCFCWSILDDDEAGNLVIFIVMMPLITICDVVITIGLLSIGYGGCGIF